jgi:hypothetical protein
VLLIFQLLSNGKVIASVEHVSADIEEKEVLQKIWPVYEKGKPKWNEKVINEKKDANDIAKKLEKI